MVKIGRAKGKNRVLKSLLFISILAFLIFNISPSVKGANLILNTNFSISSFNDQRDTGPSFFVDNCFDFLSNNADTTTFWSSTQNSGVNLNLTVVMTDKNYTIGSITFTNYDGGGNAITGFNLSVSNKTNQSNHLVRLATNQAVALGANYTYNFTTPVPITWIQFDFYPTIQQYKQLMEIWINTTDRMINLSVQPRDPYTNKSLEVFNVTIDGTQYNSTTGAVETRFNNSNNNNLSILFKAPNYLQQVINNYNISLNGTTLDSSNITFYKSRHNITVFKAPQNTTTIDNFQIDTTEGDSFNTTSGSVLVNTSWNISTRLDLNTSDYQIMNWTATGSSDGGHIFNAFQKNTFDINFFDEITWNLFDLRGVSENNVSLELISSIYANNYTTDNGTMLISLLTPAEYTFRFKDINGWYYERTYVANLETQSYNLVDLYMLNKSYSNAINVTATVLTNLNEKLEGATITVTKFNLADNAYITIEKINTNFEGIAKLHLTTDEYYKFVIEYQGNTVLSTSGTYIYEDELSFVVDLGTDPTEDFFEVEDITFTLDFSNVTNRFTYTYNDPLNRFSQTCLRVFTINATTGNELYNSSCQTSHTGTIILGVQESNGTTYMAKATATLDGESIVLGTMFWGYREYSGFGKIGIFIIILLTATFALIGIWNPFVAVLLTPVPLVLGSILGVISITTAVVGGVVVAVGFVALFIGGKS